MRIAANLRVLCVSFPLQPPRGPSFHAEKVYEKNVLVPGLELQSVCVNVRYDFKACEKLGSLGGRGF
jgi:hypothetical protein